MAGNITFSMIKPGAIQAGHMGQIITLIERAGFCIKALKLTQLSQEDAQAFYAVHKVRPFYASMCSYIASGPVLAMVLAKDNAVIAFRKLIGATNPADAKVGTIRKQFGSSIEANAVHGADADETAAQEIAFFFPEKNSS